MHVPTKINWSSTVFYAEAEQEQFTEVKIITLKAHFLQEVQDIAVDNINFRNKKESDLDDAIYYKSMELINENRISVQQFVDVQQDQIVVCLNIEEINDDTIMLALDTLANVGVTHKGKKCFGSVTNFKTHELRLYS